MLYVQVAYLLSTPEVVRREFSPLHAIPDNYPKPVLSLDTLFGADSNGVRWMNVVDFLLSDTGPSSDNTGGRQGDS